MASRLLDRLKRSLFKDGQGAGGEQEAGGGGQEEEEEEEGEQFSEERWEAELAEEEECVTERLGGTLCFDSGTGPEDGAEGDGSGLDSDSDFLGESMEEGLSSTDTSPVGVSPLGPSPSSLLTRQLQESWRSLRSLGGGGGGGGGGGPAPSGRRMTDSLLFEVTDASVVQDGSSKYVLYTVHVIQSGGSDKTPAIITRRYSDFQRLHATLRRNHGDQMERVCFPRKKLRRNFTAETIAKRSRAFEQYLSHLSSLGALRGAPCVRQFFFLSDLQTGQLLIRVGRYQEALGPLLNAKRLQQKLGWASFYDGQAQAPPPLSSHWFFTLVGLSCCFQEVDQLEEARDHCDLALRVLTPGDTQTDSEDKPLPPEDRPLPPEDKPLPPENSPLPPENRPLPAEDSPLPLSDKPLPPEDKPLPHIDKPLPQTAALPPHIDRPHPLLLPLLRAVVRLSWQTGRDKRQWEELLQQLEEQWAEPDNQPTIKEFLVKHSLQESEGEG